MIRARTHRFWVKPILGALVVSLMFSCAPTDNTGNTPTGLFAGLVPTAAPESGTSESNSDAAGTANFKASETYTSVIIDARGLNLQASMSPVIYSDSGAELYPGGIPVDPDFAVNEGIATYVYGSLDKAKASARAGDNPLVIKARAAEGRFSVVILAQDTISLSQADGRSLLLSHYKVVFLLDE